MQHMAMLVAAWHPSFSTRRLAFEQLLGTSCVTTVGVLNIAHYIAFDCGLAYI